VELADPDLLLRAGAAPELVTLIARPNDRVLLPPPGISQPEGNEVLNRLARTDSLFDRLAEPGGEEELEGVTDWLSRREGEDVLRLIRQLRQAVWGSEPADSAVLLRVLRLMPRRAVLRQTVAWEVRPHDRARWKALETLLNSSRL
jgi:hypothetical protein